MAARVGKNNPNYARLVAKGSPLVATKAPESKKVGDTVSIGGTNYTVGSKRFDEEIAAGGTPSTPVASARPANQRKTAVPVLSSKAAEKDYYSRIKPAYEEAKAGIEQQRSLLDQQRAIEDQKKALESTTQLDEATRQAKLEEIKQKTLLIQNELKQNEDAQAPAMDFTEYAGGTDTTAPAGTSAPAPVAVSPEITATKPYQSELDKLEAEYQKEAARVSKTITDITRGVVPLTAAETAQINGLEQQFKQLIQEQGLINKGATGTANIRGYQSGAAEYDPNFQIKTIGSIATAGINKVADLNTKMAAAIAEMENSFRTDKIAAVKSAFEIYEKTADKRRETLQDTIERTTKAIEEARKEQEQLRKEQYDRVEKPLNELIVEAAKGGATPEVIAAMKLSGDVVSAAQLGGTYLQTGEYSEVARAFRQAGLTPPSVSDYYARKIYGDNAFGGAGDPMSGDVPFAATLEIAAANAGPSDKVQATALGNLAQLAKSGDYPSLLTAMENLARKGMGADQGKEVFQAQNQIKAVTDLQEVLDEYEALGGQLGPLPATAKALTQKIGAMGADPRFTELATRMTAAFQKYRMEMSGAAFGAKESAQYKSVLPSGDKDFKLNRAVINGLKDFLNNNVNNAYETQLGEGYRNVKDYVEKGLTPTGAYLLKTEQDAKKKLQELGTTDPTIKAQVEEILTNDPDLNYYDILDVLNVNYETSPKGNVSYSGIPGGATGKVVGGYDIGTYATDPNHEARVATIYNKTRNLRYPAAIDEYIQSVAPGSPVKGTEVIAAANANSVDPGMMLAIMQQDSTFGTAGKAVRTKNPGNVGNTDDGSTRAFDDWATGVMAVAENLAKRKVS